MSVVDIDYFLLSPRYMAEESHLIVLETTAHQSPETEVSDAFRDRYLRFIFQADFRMNSK